MLLNDLATLQGNLVSHMPCMPHYILLEKGNVERALCTDENSTWDFVDKPMDGVLIGSKWVYSIKIKADDTIDRYKARLVAQGYKQEYGVDYEATFIPVAKMTTAQTLLALDSIKGWTLHQLDVKNVFLHSDLEEVVFVKPPPGFVLPRPNVVCHL